MFSIMCCLSGHDTPAQAQVECQNIYMHYYKEISSISAKNTSNTSNNKQYYLKPAATFRNSKLAKLNIIAP